MLLSIPKQPVVVQTISMPSRSVPSAREFTLFDLAWSPIYSLYRTLKDLCEIQEVTSQLKTLHWLISSHAVRTANCRPFVNACCLSLLTASGSPASSSACGLLVFPQGAVLFSSRDPCMHASGSWDAPLPESYLYPFSYIVTLIFWGDR